MIWLRRILVIPLGLLFFVVLLAAVLIFRLNSTVLDPGFYADQFRKADLYTFLLNNLVTSAIDEVRDKEADDLPGGFNKNPMDTIDLSTDKIVSALNRAVPPAWVQEQVEQMLDQAGGYFNGGRDDFQFTIRAKERATGLVSETRDLLIKADTYNILLDEVVEPKVDEALENEGILPFRIPLSGSRIVDAAKRVAPQDWVEEQVVMAIDEVTPYAVGDRDDFEVKVEVADRVDTALREIKELLREADAYNLLYDEVIAPKVLETLGQGIELPYGIEVRDDEVLAALREVAPPEWVQEQVEGVIDAAAPYLVGTKDDLQITVSLVDNKRDAGKVINRLANDRLKVIVDELPKCTEGEDLARDLLTSGGQPPKCLPPELNIPQALELLFNLAISEPLAEAIDTKIPDNLTFTDTDLRQRLVDAGSERNVDLLDQVREVLSEGWTYTDMKLRQDIVDNIGDDAVRVLDDVRDALRDGWTYTDVGFRQDLTDAEESEALDSIDDVRNVLGQVRTFQWAPYLLALLILVGIGFLGGRRWHSRIAWAAAVLAVASLIIFIATGPVYSAVGSDLLEDARVDALEDLTGTKLLAADKALTIAQTAADDFFSGLSVPSLIIFIIGVITLFITLAWPTNIGLRVRRRRRLVSADEPASMAKKTAPSEGTEPPT